MKANEVPDKIYLLHDDRYVDDLSIIWFETPYATGSIEYTRTDAFIEKAVEFFDEHLWEYIDIKNANCDAFVNINSNKFEEDFINYIKGE